jgi:RNA polymerase-interacting CarD/CdnL/TRCF family regulator
MFNEDTAFQVGDQVIHWVYGLGEIIQLDEKVLSGKSSKYYVVQMSNMTLWVPMNEAGEHHLRFPTQAKDFTKLVNILASPGESLPPDRHARRMHLTTLLEDGSLASICRVVRDLEHYKKDNKTNEYDHTILERARDSLVTEWSVALSMPVQQVEYELSKLLV